MFNKGGHKAKIFLSGYILMARSEIHKVQVQFSKLKV